MGKCQVIYDTVAGELWHPDIERNIYRHFMATFLQRWGADSQIRWISVSIMLTFETPPSMLGPGRGQR